MKPLRSSLIIPVLLWVIYLIPTADASILTVNGIGKGYQDVSLLLNGSTTPTTEYAVEILVGLNNTSYTAYCVDLFTNITFDSYNNTTGLPDGYGGQGQRLAWIFANYSGLVSNDEMASALQLALWDVQHDGGNGLDQGNIRIDPNDARYSSLLADANAIVAASAGQTSMDATILYNAVIATGQPAQTLITGRGAYEPPFGTTPTGEVPEPSSLGLLLGAGPVLWLLRKRAMGRAYFDSDLTMRSKKEGS